MIRQQKLPSTSASSTKQYDQYKPIMTSNKNDSVPSLALTNNNIPNDSNPSNNNSNNWVYYQPNPTQEILMKLQSTIDHMNTRMIQLEHHNSIYGNDNNSNLHNLEKRVITQENIIEKLNNTVRIFLFFVKRQKLRTALRHILQCHL